MSHPSREQQSREDTGDAGLIAYAPDLLYAGGRFQSGMALVCDPRGRIASIVRADEFRGRVVRFRNRAALPGLANAHSHAFQRVIRGRTEYRTRSVASERDSFWTWREMMYSAAERLTPADIYDASRMAFLEMALCGITAVGEFHYIHHAPDGAPYDDPNLISKEVIRAAADVGLRIALLRVAYTRSGYQSAENPLQARFIERDPAAYLSSVERLRAEVSRASDSESAWVGLAPHSVRAVPLYYLQEVAVYARETGLPLHMHVAEQMAEVRACLEEYSRTPVELLASEGLLTEHFTAVHAVHITPDEAHQLAATRSTVCACPTTERNLGDGIVPADLLFREGVRVALGTDSHAQIDLLEDARELELNLRLQKLERNLLALAEGGISSLAVRLFECATVSGARSIGALDAGELAPGNRADFFTVALDDTSIAGASTDDLLPAIVFSLSRTAVRELFVGGRQVVEEAEHSAQHEIVERFTRLQKRLWS